MTLSRDERLLSRWALRHRVVATLLLSLLPVQGLSAAVQSPVRAPQVHDETEVVTRELSMFGPRKYVRTTGPKNVYVESFTVPAWLRSPFRLHVENGAPDGTRRVSSSTVEVNEAVVVTTSDLNQNVAALDRAVALNETNELRVTLASVPTSYLTINIFGTSADYTPPLLTWALPAAGGTVNSATPRLLVRYEDRIGEEEPAASGVDLMSLQVFIDEVDRTSWFTRRSDEASGTIPAGTSLSEGLHSFKAVVYDLARNRSEVEGTFRVDLTRPEIAITAPAGGSYLPTTQPPLSVRYMDDIALDVSSLSVLVNGADLTPWFTRGPADAAVVWPAEVSLAEGPNQMSVAIRDAGGNEATASLLFNVDITPPRLTIARPAEGSRSGSSDVPVTLTWTDEQGVLASSARATLGGTPVALTIDGDSASGQLQALADGTHTLTATIGDLAGNGASAASTFIVDTTVPAITVVEPPSGANINDNTPAVVVTYSDANGLDSSTFRVDINSIDRTHLFVQADASASAQIDGFTLPDGINEIAAEIRDLTSNLGRTVSSFLVDTVLPVGSIESPGAFATSSTPPIVVRYSDSGSGIEPSSALVTVDGTPYPGLLSPGADSATGTLPELSDGQHIIAASFADRAGNTTTVQRSTTVDTVAPALVIAAPGDDSFTNTTTPAFRITYGDAGGTGVVVESLRVVLQKRSSVEVDITSYLAATVSEAAGIIPEEAALADGTYDVRATIRDVAGNVATAEASFEVDTVAPLYTIEAPAANGYVDTALPQFTIRWSDELSGIDLARTVISIDGIERTERFALTASGADGMLEADEALGDGRHLIELVLYDRAGNAAAVTPQSFTVDTIDPVVSIESPVAGGYIGKTPYTFSITWTDASGVDPASVRVTIDGVDHSASFVAGPDGATAEITTALSDGAHTMDVVVLDWAANSGSAQASFIADATPPTISISEPAPGTWLKGPAVTVKGTTADASPLIVEVNGILAATTTGEFTATVPAEDGPFVIRALARDAAANEAAAEVAVQVDSAPPVITLAQPVEGLVTNASDVTVSGNVSDVSAVTLTLDGQPLQLSEGSFTATVPLENDGERSVTLVATDAAGNSSTLIRRVIRDTVAPVVTVASPSAGTVVGSLPLVIRGTIADATDVVIRVDGATASITEGAWEISIDGLADGSQTLTIDAVDAAGNAAAVTHEITVDTAAPLLTILLPVSGSLSREETATISGTVSDLTLQSVTSAGMTAVLEAGSEPGEQAFTIAGVPLADGDNTLKVIATDALSRTTEASVLVTRDSVPPSLEVDAPSLITRSRGAQVSATAADNLALRDVLFVLGDITLASLTAEPYQLSVAVPETAQPGDDLLLTVTATDTAGNKTTVTRSMRVAAEGAVTGQVLSDTTGLPIAGARVSIAGTSDETVTDDRGRYALPANDQYLTLVVEPPAGFGMPRMTSVERNVTVQSGVGTVPVDARLTPFGGASEIGASGGTLQRDNITIEVPAGVVGSATPMYVVPLTGQGLPNLLPLGWTPAAAFGVVVDGEVSADVPMNASVAGSPALVHVAAYRPEQRAWVLLAANISASDGVARFAIPGPGSYALVLPDDPSIAGTPIDEPLLGLAMVPIPPEATSSGSVNPPTLPPTGGQAEGRLVIHSPQPLPAGTVVQAEVSESFSLSSGETASTERRTQDIVLYREGNDLAAEFPITPSRTFASGELTDGTVHLDILAGREAVRGVTGGQQPLDLAAGDIDVTIPAGALPRDIAIAARPAVLSSFLPATPAARPFAEVVLDFGGMVLTIPAELSVAAENVAASESVVLARVERIGGVPHVVAVASTERVADRFVTRPLGSIDALRHDGRYVFYRIGIPWGLVGGSVSFATLGTPAVIRTDALPFVAITHDGAFELVAAAGTTRIAATVRGTSLTGETMASVPEGGVTTVMLSVAPTVTTAVMTPADGAVRIPVSTQIEITASAPLAGASVHASSIVLTDAAGVAVPLRFVISGSGRIVAAVPLAGLQPGQTYSIAVQGLRDIYGGAVAVDPARFTTLADEPPSYDTNLITFTAPDADGIVTVSAPPGALPPGTRILIVNAGSGVVVSYTAGNDGSFSGQFPASISDRLLITITDPQGNVVNFERSKFVFTDGSGRVAIGAGGGEVEGSGGTAIRIPPGALPEGAVFKVDFFGPEKFPERPTTFPDAHFGGGLTITSEQMPKLKEEGKLVFPKPADAPDGAFYYVMRRMTGPNGRVDFETVDHAFPEGDKIVTASYPYIGWDDSVNAWDAASTAIGFGLSSQINFFLMWSFDASFPGLPLPGMIVGKAYEVVYEAGNPNPVYKPVSGAMVSAIDETGMVLWNQPDVQGVFARSQGDGTFALWDPKYTGGPVKVHAMYGGNSVVTTAFQANPTDTKTFFDGLFVHFRNVANVNVTFPPKNEPPSPEVEVHVMRLTQSLQRVDIDGIAVADTPLLIGFRFRTDVQGEILNATVGIEQVAVKRDDGAVGSGMPMDFITVNPWMPNAAGTYTVRTTVLNPLGGPPLEVDHTFIVVAGSGTNGAPIHGAAPDWITKKLVPRENEFGVPLSVLPQVVFTEPVVKVVEGTELLRDGTPVAFAISGVAVGADGLPFAISDLRSAPATTAVTSITVQPIGGLDFGMPYTLRLTGSIEDLDTDPVGNPDPQRFPGRDLNFTTITPEAAEDSVETFDSGGVVIVGSHAWAIHNTGAPNNFAVAYRVGDAPLVQVGRVGVSGRAVDISGETNAVVNHGHPAIVVGSGLKFIPEGPSNVYLFDVRDPAQPKRIAAVSVTEGPQDGTVLQLYMRKRFAYAVRSFPQAIQVIDLEIAKQAYERASSASYSEREMNKGLITAGVGFGQEAIVNSIPATPPNGGHTHLLDLKANEYVVNGVNKTLVYATGTQPFVIVDPTDTAPKSWEAPPTGQGLLQFGHALDLARVSNRDLAVVVGRGMARQNGTGDLVSGAMALFIFDLQNPLVPNLIGSHVMTATPHDVVISKGTALVATAEGVWGFSLADPTAPRFLGKIANTGLDLAVTEDGGMLVSTGPTPAVPAGGLHTALFHPTLVIETVEPLQVRVAAGSGSVDAPQEVQAVDSRQVRVRVRPRMTVTAGDLAIGNPRFTAPDGTGRERNPEIYPIAWSGDGEGIATIPAGKTYEDTYLQAIATATTAAGPLTSLPSRIKLGWVKLTVDANNNTTIDSRDDEAKRKGIPFAFWESDPDGWADETDPMRGLSDYATFRMTVNKNWKQQTDGGVVRLRVQHGDGNFGRWFVVEKKGPGVDYLANEDVAEAQMAMIPAATGGETPACTSAAPGKFHPEGKECSDDGLGTIVVPEHTVGAYDYLFRCAQCKRRPLQTTDVHDVPEIVVEYAPTAAGPWEVIDRARLDVRPVTEWMTVMTVRSAPGTGLRPIDKATLSRMTEKYPTLANTYFPSPAQMPEGAAQATVLVHGFNVSNDDAVNTFFPTYFKRLYWVGHPVHRWQGQWMQNEETRGCVKDCAHTVAINWPGNPFRVLYPEAEFRAFQSGVPVAKYLKEIAAQREERRVNVIAHSLGNVVVNTALGRPELDPAGGAPPVTRYIMNQAALPAEAFDQQYEPEAAELEYWGEKYTEVYGYPDDAVWEEDWATLIGSVHGTAMLMRWQNTVARLSEQAETELNHSALYRFRWRQTRPYPLPDVATDMPERGPWKGLFAGNRERTRMFSTWSANDRIVGVVWRGSNYGLKPFSRTGSVVQFVEHLGRELLYGAVLKWARAVAGVSATTPIEKIEDFVADNVIIQPSIPPLRSRTQDNLVLQSWALRTHTENVERAPFGGANAWNALRQYAELAYWFPANSFGAGVKDLDPTLYPTSPVCRVDTCSTDFTRFSEFGSVENPPPDLNRVPIPFVSSSIKSSLWDSRSEARLTHGYMTQARFQRTWDAYTEMKKMLDPKN